VRRICEHDTTAAPEVDAVRGDVARGTRNGRGQGPGELRTCSCTRSSACAARRGLPLISGTRARGRRRFWYTEHGRGRVARHEVKYKREWLEGGVGCVHDMRLWPRYYSACTVVYI
jgi:hypothetical protein